MKRVLASLLLTVGLLSVPAVRADAFPVFCVNHSVSDASMTTASADLPSRVLPFPTLWTRIQVVTRVHYEYCWNYVSGLDWYTPTTYYFNWSWEDTANTVRPNCLAWNGIDVNFRIYSIRTSAENNPGPFHLDCDRDGYASKYVIPGSPDRYYSDGRYTATIRVINNLYVDGWAPDHYDYFRHR
jgi:hypothetical protein